MNYSSVRTHTQLCKHGWKLAILETLKGQGPGAAQAQVGMQGRASDCAKEPKQFSEIVAPPDIKSKKKKKKKKEEECVALEFLCTNKLLVK